MSQLSRKLKPAEVVAGLAFGIAVIWYLATHDGTEKTAQAEPQTKPVVKEEIKPEMIVRIPAGKFVPACLSHNLLNELYAHAKNGEKTKADAMLKNMQCLELNDQIKYKVLSVADGDVEVLNANSDGADGVWAPADSFTITK